MRTVGIIAEYNPFHNGHRYQLQEIRRRLGDIPVIIAMSGYFTQRGDPALVNKWTRARWAADGGANLLLELPTAFALRSAQGFAAGGVRLLAAAGVDAIAFGAETDDLPLLQFIADLSGDDSIIGSLKLRMKSGISYAASFSEALAARRGSRTDAAALRETIKSPNNILAIQYLRAIKKYAPSLTPLLIPRKGAGYHQEAAASLAGSAVAGASAIRKALLSIDECPPKILQSMPPRVADELSQMREKGQLSEPSGLFPAILGRLLPLTAAEIASVHGAGEGLENLLWAALREPSVTSLSRLAVTLKSKRYPYARLSRLLTAALLNLSKKAVQRFDETGPLYLRPLAFDDRGRQLLAQLRERYRDKENVGGALPVITTLYDFLPRLARRGSQPAAPLTALQEMLALDLLAAELWKLSLSSETSETIVPETKAAIYYKRE